MAPTFSKWLTLCLILTVHLLEVCGAASVVEVDPEVKTSVEEFLKTRSKLRMDDKGPLKMSSNHIDAMLDHQLPKKRLHQGMEMVEEVLRLVYHELYEVANHTEFANIMGLANVTELANVTDILTRYRSLSPRQSFFSNGLNSVSEYLMSLVENSLEDLPSLPRLEAQECMKRSVCEAHNQPKKYGLIGLVLQLLFPPYTTKATEEPTNTISKYQLAARYGRQSNANCGVQYDGCMLNLLDIVQALVNAFIR